MNEQLPTPAPVAPPVPKASKGAQASAFNFSSHEGILAAVASGEDGIVAAMEAGALEEHHLDARHPAHAKHVNELRRRASIKPVFIKVNPNDDEIPGPSLQLIVNQKEYFLPVKRWCRVPSYVLMQLRNSRKLNPALDENDKIIGWEDNERFTFNYSETTPNDDEYRKRGFLDMTK